MIDRESILDEIRRTAAANVGRALGRQRFEDETGIKQSDWFGIHWASWGAALNAAGLEANEFTKGYDEDWLVERLVQVVRELGKWPTEGEIRMHCRNRSDLPDGKAFRRRLGCKSEMARRVRDYCEAQSGFDDVVTLAQPFVVESVPASLPDSDERSIAVGYVYLMRFGKYHKVGRSNSVGRREYELGTKLPEELVTVHSIKTDDPVGIERYWHQRFAEKRREGEWFELNSAEIQAFKRWRRIC